MLHKRVKCLRILIGISHLDKPRRLFCCPPFIAFPVIHPKQDQASANIEYGWSLTLIFLTTVVQNNQPGQVSRIPFKYVLPTCGETPASPTRGEIICQHEPQIAKFIPSGGLADIFSWVPRVFLALTHHSRGLNCDLEGPLNHWTSDGEKAGASLSS